MNVLGHLRLTRVILPQMLERKEKPVIINVSSFTADFPLPIASIYSASKRFNNHFSNSLALELYKDIEVMSLKPLYVTTKLTHYVKGSGAILPTVCASGALN